jgi:hypothetical protein
MSTETIRLPWKFYIDHAERSLPTPDDVRSTKTHVYVSATDHRLVELLGDAEFYCDPHGPDADWLGGLKRSAAATVKAIKTHFETRKSEWKQLCEEASRCRECKEGSEHGS